MTPKEAFDLCEKAALRLGFGPHRNEELTTEELEAVRMMAEQSTSPQDFGGVYFLEPVRGAIDAGDFETMD